MQCFPIHYVILVSLVKYEAFHSSHLIDEITEIFGP